MSGYRTPTKDGLDGMLEMVAGEDAESTPTDEASVQVSHHAVFVNREDVPVATCVCDLEATAKLGCALSMIPPAGAEGMIEDKELTAMASSNFAEVMNIFSSLFMDDSSDHLRLTDTGPGAPPVTLEGGRAAAFKLDLGRYGNGGGLVFRHV